MNTAITAEAMVAEAPKDEEAPPMPAGAIGDMDFSAAVATACGLRP
ncbi:hypothetical protein [Halochromatium sp.]